MLNPNVIFQRIKCRYTNFNLLGEVGGKNQNAFFFLPEKLESVYEWPHEAYHPAPHSPLCPICPAVEGTKIMKGCYSNYIR